MFNRFFGGRGRRYALGAVLMSCGALAPTAASAATTVGSTQLRGNGAFANEFTVCAEACTISMRALPGHQVTAPSNGVIVRFQSGSTTGNLTFSVIRNNATVGPAVAGTGTGDTQTFPAQLAVRAGDRIAITLQAGGTYGARFVQGAALDRWTPPLGSSARNPDYRTPEDTEILFNATIEPDADGDGLGDESQDPSPPGGGNRTGTEGGTTGRGRCSARGTVIHNGRFARIARIGRGRSARFLGCYKATGRTTTLARGRVGLHAATSTGRFVGFATRVSGREHVHVFDTSNGRRRLRTGRTRGTDPRPVWRVGKIVVTNTGHAAWVTVYSGRRARPGTRNQVIAFSTRGILTLDDGRIPASSLRLRESGVDVQWTKAGSVVGAEIG